MKTKRKELQLNELKNKFIELRTHNIYVSRAFVLRNTEDVITLRIDNGKKCSVEQINFDHETTIRVYQN